MLSSVKYDMPIPNPSKTDKKTDFIQRCMSDKVMNKEFSDQKQRYAVCMSKWKDKKSKASIVVTCGDEEFLA